MTYRLEGVVQAILSERPGAQELRIRTMTEQGEAFRLALNFVDLLGTLQVGDAVLLNTVAMDMGLGTGGADFVIASMPRRLPSLEPQGHILKMRYTPFQTPVCAIESPESPHHDAVATFQSLQETPVICMGLHSQLAGVCAGIRWATKAQKLSRPPRVVYIMTDSAALPIALSRMVARLKEEGMLQETVTAGQAFGGDYEAINLYSALAAAKAALHADLILVGQGPGNAGTDTRLGFSGIDQAVAANAVASLGGDPILVPRISFSDPRPRHQGVSHHTQTILKTALHTPVWLPIPRLPLEQLIGLHETINGLNCPHDVRTVTLDADRCLEELAPLRDVATTMGRPFDQDAVYFLAACAAGVLATQLAEANLIG